MVCHRDLGGPSLGKYPGFFCQFSKKSFSLRTQGLSSRRHHREEHARVLAEILDQFLSHSDLSLKLQALPEKDLPQKEYNPLQRFVGWKLGTKTFEVRRNINYRNRKGKDRSYSYKLALPNLNAFNQEGFKAVIAQREGREITLETQKVGTSNELDEYYPFGTPKIYFILREQGGGSEEFGKARVYLEPNRLSYFYINTENMPHQGVGSLFTDWIFTQAALRGEGVGIKAITNPRVLEIVHRNQLLDPTQSATVEVFAWDPP